MTNRPLVIKYNPLWAVPSFLAGLLNAYVATLPNTRVMSGFLAVLFLVLGGLFIWRPMLVVDEASVQVKNLFGMTLKTYPIDSLADLVFERSKLMVRSPSGELVKVRGTARWVASPADWARLQSAVANAHNAAEPEATDSSVPR